MSNDLIQTLIYLSRWAIVGLVGMALYCLGAGSGAANIVSMFSSSVLLSLAFASIGGLIGFLFGIPRTLQGDFASEEKDANVSGSPEKPQNGSNGEYRQRVNTNLEHISDWLTKVLVGAGLVEFQTIFSKAEAVGRHFQSSFAGSDLVVLAVIGSSTIWGFFSGYILTRLFLASAFAKADQSINMLKGELSRAQEAIQKKTSEVVAQSKKIYKELEGTISSAGNLSEEDQRSKYEELIFNSLYVEAPKGFEDAIKYSEEFLTPLRSTKSPLIWAYQAAAYGQKHVYLRLHGGTFAEIQQARDNALKAVREALGLDQKMKQLLNFLWDPTNPGKYRGSADDDLESFYDDPEFKELLQV